MVVDMDIWLEVLLEQEHAEECAEFLQLVANGEISAYVTDFAVHGIVVILERRGRREQIRDFLATLEGFRGLILLHATLAEQIEIAEFAQQTGLTFDDAYQAFFAQRLNVPVVSFDSDYYGIVPRVEPSEILRRR